MMQGHQSKKSPTLHVIAIFEALKGIIALAASIGLLGILHHDVRHFAHEMIGHFGVNPDSHYPSILLHYADVLKDANLRTLVFAAIAYIVIRLLEAYGLWNDLAWAEWLGALSGALYIPFEIRHLIYKPSVISAMVFGINVFVVGFLAYRLYRRRSLQLHSLPQPRQRRP